MRGLSLGIRDKFNRKLPKKEPSAHGVTAKEIKFRASAREKDAASRVRSYTDADGKLHFVGQPEDVEQVHNAYMRLQDSYDEAQRKKRIKDFRG